MKLLCCKIYGIFYGGFNSPLWYLSVLIWGGFFIFELLKRDEDLYIKILGPLIVIITFGIIKTDNLQTIENWKTIYGLYMPFWRGISDITIGCIISKLFIKYKETLENAMINKKFLLHIIEIYSYIALLYLIINDTKYDIYSLIYISIIIISCNLNNSLSYKIFNRKIFKNCGKLSLLMYFNHLAIIKVLIFIYKKFFTSYINNVEITIIYFIILIIYSIIFNKFIKFLNEKVINRKEII